VPPRHHIILFARLHYCSPSLEGAPCTLVRLPELVPTYARPTNKRYVKYPSTFQSLTTVFLSSSLCFSFSPLCVHCFLFFPPFLPVMVFIVMPGLSFRPSLLSSLFPVFDLHLPPHLLVFVNYVSKYIDRAHRSSHAAPTCCASPSCRR